jgi:hypothetical protein
VVKVNGTSANRYAHLYHRELSVDNSSAEAYPLIEVDHQDNGVDESGRSYVPPETEDFDYDDDGNLTRDSRWDYTWNSENRLTTMTTRTVLNTNIPQIELSFTYDHQGRRIRKIVAETHLHHESHVGAQTQFPLLQIETIARQCYRTALTHPWDRSQAKFTILGVEFATEDAKAKAVGRMKWAAWTVTFGITSSTPISPTSLPCN